jgi:hypothetical protein
VNAGASTMGRDVCLIYARRLSLPYAHWRLSGRMTLAPTCAMSAIMGEPRGYGWRGMGGRL